MGNSGKSPVDQANRLRSVISLVLKIGGVVAFILLVLLFYRMSGFIAANKTYSCVEKTISVVDRVNLLFDAEEGVLIEDAEVISEEAEEAITEIEGSDVCSGGASASFTGELADAQMEVDEAAVAYLEMVSETADKVAQGADTWDDTDEVVGLYESFLNAVEGYESELEEVESRFLLEI